MLRAFSTAATGMIAQQQIVDVIANNLANINTVGFKRSQVDFQDLMYVKLAEAGREDSAGTVAPVGFEIGSGVKSGGTVKVYTQGEQENTGRSLDLSIQGDGFFQVTMPDGSTRYTRNGQFLLDAEGNLVTSTGALLEPPITIPADTRTINIAPDGEVSAFVGSEQTPTSAGQIQLVRFPNPAGLSSLGGNLLAATEASGTASTGTAGENGYGRIQSGFLERSNVQMVTELVNLIKAQRAYEINSRAIKAGDDMLTTANRLVG